MVLSDGSDHSALTALTAEVKPEEGLKSRRIASFGFVVFGGLSIGLLALSLPFVVPALRGHVLPYIPATDTQVKHVLRLVKKNRPSSLVDLGSGDGRIVIGCAKIGIPSVGVELNPCLGVNQLTRFERKDLWKVDTSEYDTLVIFGVQDMMNPLAVKIAADCDRSRRPISVIACRFPLAEWTPVATIGDGIDTVWLYHYSNPSA